MPRLRFGRTYRRSIWVSSGLLGVIAVAFAVAGPVPTAPRPSLTAPRPVHEFRIELRQESMRALRQNPRSYVRGTMQADGTDFREVGLHLKGATGSFRSLDDQPGWTLDLGHFGSPQAFCGVTKFHLNNSIEDPSYLCQLIGSEVFRAAGLPTPEVAHGLVWLNGRRLGLYVVAEGFTEAFRRRNFPGVDGLLLEPNPGQDIDGRLEVKGVQTGEESATAGKSLHSLVVAAREPDLERRWERLQAVLEVDPFITFTAMEVLLGHRDGYSLAKNNFRIHINETTGRVLFLPQGFDQLFEPADLPWQPNLAGLVSRAVLETSVGQSRYSERVRAIFAEFLQPEELIKRVSQASTKVRAFLPPAEAALFDQETLRLEAKISRRIAGLERQFQRPPLRPLDLSSGAAGLRDWVPLDVPSGGRLTQEVGPEGTPSLAFVAGSVTFSSWRTTVKLPKGRYRFEGRARVTGVKPLPFGRHQGLVLRVSGDRARSHHLVSDSSWQMLSAAFGVELPEEDLELICELRASAGQAWLETASLRLIKID